MLPPSTPILQHHLLELQLVVVHLQDGFKQQVEVHRVACRRCRGVLGYTPGCCSRGFSDALKWANACVQRHRFYGAQTSGSSNSVGWIGELLHGDSIDHA